MSTTLSDLFAVIQSRKANLPEGSYTTTLFRKGQPEILKKIGEEAVEVIIAATSETEDRIIYEMADLIYHNMVRPNQDRPVADVEAELARRAK